MSFSLRFTAMLLALGVSALMPGLSARGLAQTPSAQPPPPAAEAAQPRLLEVEGVLQSEDDTLSDGSFYDIHEFTGQADQIVTILLESEAFDPYLIFADDQGNRIAANDDISTVNPNAALIIALPSAGRYRVAAIAQQADAQGPYRLTIHPAPADQPNPLLSEAEATLLEAKQQLQSGLEHYRRSEFRAALALWEEALALLRVDNVRAAFPLDSLQGEAAALGNLGNAYDTLGDYVHAIDFLQQSIAIARQLGQRQGEANALVSLGNPYFSLGDYAQAIDFYQQSLTIFHQLGDRGGEARSLGNLGNAYFSLGDYAQAIDFHQQSLDIDRQIGDRRGEVVSLGSLGVVYRVLGDYAQAIDFHQQQLDIANQLGDQQGEAAALGNLGLAYYALGDYAQAIDFLRQSLDIARQIGDRQGETRSLGNLGNAYYALGDYAQAIDFLQQVLDIARQIGDRQGETRSLGNLGNAYYALGDYAQAIDFLQQSITIKRQIGDRQGEATFLGNLGNVYYALGDYVRAIDFHQQSLAIKRQIGDRPGEGISFYNLGLTYWVLEDLTKAERYFQSSAHIQESLHSTDLADANRLSLLDSQQKTYLLWQTTLMAQGRPETALEVAERGRAQALAASMARSLTLKPATPNLERIQDIAAEQNATLVEYSVLPSGRILIWVIQPDGSLQSAESDAAALDDSLVETTDRLTGLGQNRSRGAQPLETPLSALVQDTQAALTVRGRAQSQISRQDLDSHLQQLHAALIEPIAQWLPEDDRQRVIFIPHRELFRVPFAALRDAAGQYLIQKHTILTAPSIQSLDLARQHRARIQTVNATDALVVGNPTLSDALQEKYGWQALPGAETEARKIGDYLSQRLGTSLEVLIHNQATETRVKERLHAARFIHLATHGALTSSDEAADLPGLQYNLIPGVLAFAASDQDDGGLTADELLELTINNPLNAELVVLSACQTGRGPITSDGVYGLSRTLLRAGVPTLVVSLWDASDYHTVGLMDEFYRQFLEEGQDKAQALRQAMLWMIEQGDNNPQYWAAFTLVGEAQ